MSNKVVITGISTNDLPKITKDEALTLLKRIKQGDADSKKFFIECNLRLVLSMVQRFNLTKVNPDDLFQIGIIGLIKAIDNFDTTLGVRFSTYAVPMILGEMKRYIRESTALKVGRSIRDVAYKAMTARDELERKGSGDVSLSDIAVAIDTPYAEVVSALDAISDPVSLYEAAYNDGEEGMLVIDQIREPDTEEEKFNRISLREGISRLPEKERAVINMRYFLGKTQTEISKELAISQAQVSRLENSALVQLKKAF